MTLNFYALLNLDTNTAQPESNAPLDPGWDVSLSSNPTRPVRAVVFQRQLGSGIQIAHLRGRSFDTVTYADVASAAFGTALVDEPFDTTRVILIRTDTGAVFKLGSDSETAGAASFRHARLTPGDCACTVPVAARVDLGFYHLMNLDTGTAEPESNAPLDAGWDFALAYNGTRPVRSVVFQKQLGSGVEIAHLRGRNFGTVTFADIGGASFGTTLIDEPFDATRVILIRTDAASVFKLGSDGETASGNSFRYARLRSGDCP